MQVMDDVRQIREPLSHGVAAIGFFDGVHLGHQAIVREVVRRAREEQGEAIILSFSPHPQKLIASQEAPPLLQTFEQKAEIFESLGVDLFLRLPFTRKLSLLSPEKFVEEVIAQAGFREVLVGDNFRFGHRRQGDLETLQRLGRQFGFAVHVTSGISFRGVRVSSTRIRRSIQAGRLALAKRLLARPYAIRGTVVLGAQRGRELGFPTANLQTDNELFPPLGVYVSRVRLGEETYLSATNVGFRPTLHGYREPQPTVETHLIDFSGDLYGQEVTVEFCFRLRPERKFDNVQALIRQIERDLRRVQEYAKRFQKATGRSG